MPIRFAILAGVSKDIQAREEKFSIPDQIKNCRSFIVNNRGVESAGPFIMDGYSRTGYDSLDVAMTEIPPLGEAVQAAMDNQYDILVMDNFDRLGDVGFILKTRFKKYRKQLHSVRQSGKLTPPEQYDPYADESGDIAMHVEGIIQGYRINKIRRGWNIGIPERARAGLHPLCTAFGYKPSGNKNEPALQIPEKTQLVIQLKDMFLAGKTLQQLCDHANASGIKPLRAKKWTRTVVKRIVLNKYYAGFTIFGKYKTISNNERVLLPPSQWIVGEGKHIALWDEQTYFAILAEAERRDGLRARAKTYALTGLLTCSVCESRLYRHGKLNARYEPALSCENGHVHIYYSQAHTAVAKEIVTGLQHLKNAPVRVDQASEWQTKIDAQLQLRSKIQEGFETNLYTATEANQRIVSIETEVERLMLQRDRANQRQQQQAALLKFAKQDIENIYEWIMTDDPTTVNHLLTSLCEKVTLSPTHEINIQWR